MLERGAVRVTIADGPFAIEIRRGRRLIRGLGLWTAAGEARDQFIQLTEMRWVRSSSTPSPPVSTQSA